MLGSSILQHDGGDESPTNCPSIANLLVLFGTELHTTNRQRAIDDKAFWHLKT